MIDLHRIEALDAGSACDPDARVAIAPHTDGSWWPEWMTWLARRSAREALPR